MRSDNLQFKAANEAPAKAPRFVVAILFDAGSLYITSHTGIASVPGVVLDAALQRPSAISQRIIPDQGSSEIGTFSFDVVDLLGDFTDEVRAKLAAGKGLRGKTVQLWCGFRGFDFSAFQLFQTQVITDVRYQDGVYSISCNDITRQQRTNIFDVKATTLAVTCTADDATISVADTSAFLPVTHGPNWTDAPNSTVFYFKIENEIIRATGKTSTTFTGCTRGQFNTRKAQHTVDSTAPQERRPKVEEFVYLDLPAPKTALALLTGAIFSTWPANLVGADGDLEVDTNADGVANNWTLFHNDGGRVATASTPSGSSPFVGKVQRLAITSVTNSNPSGFFWTGQARAGLTLTVSGYIRTNVGAKAKIDIQFLNSAGAPLITGSSSFVAGDSIAHLAQATATAPALTESVRVYFSGINAASEFLEFDRVMLELGSTVHAYTSSAIQGFLPQHWHMGLEPEFVQFANFIGIGTDLWNLTDDSKGFVTRFEGITKTDGKQFLERQLYLLLGAYQPVYSDGTVGLKRLPAMVSSAAPVAVLTEREVISIEPLQHDYSSLHNQIRVTWAYDIGIGEYTRDTLFIDAQSVAIHGEAPVIEYQFRGLHPGAHTDNMIRTRLDAVRDAYSYPPERTSVVCVSSLNRFETGDVFRIQVANVRDFAGATTTIDRGFLVMYRSINFETGDVAFEIFGSTLRPEAQAPSAEGTAPMPDGFYTSAGVALSTVVGMTGNSVNAGTHSISGNTDMNAAGAVVFHNGDLVIPNGATINISQNVQLRVKGFITLNGVINGKGGGLAGTSDPGGVLVEPVKGNEGFIGNSRGWDGPDAKQINTRLFYAEYATVPAALTKAKFEAWPEINLTVLGSTLQGLPSDLRGTGGGPGGRAVRTYQNTFVNGGSGASGGAGLVIVCRGISFGVSASINLDGNDSASTSLAVTPFADLYPGCGGAGGPGACLIVLDGNTLTFPNAAGRFSAKCGVVPQLGVPLPSRYLKIQGGEFLQYFPGGISTGAWAGYKDEQIITGLDLSVAALRVKYLPFTQTPAPDQQRLPAPILDLTATPGPEFNTVQVTLPELGTFDVIDVYAAITNNRAGAVLVNRGRSATFDHKLPVLSTRYYWAQTTRVIDETGLELHSDFFPTSPTGGISATTLNPGGWTPVTTSAGGATMVVTSSTIEKSAGTAAWDSQAYSAERYIACAVSFRANDATHDFAIGLNTDPTTDANFTSIDYAIDCGSSGTFAVYESGSSQAFSGTSSYDASTIFLITYDGERIRYFRNGAQIREALAPGLQLSLDSSFFSPGAKALDVKFQPMALITPANMFVTTGNAAYAGTTAMKLGGSAAWDSAVYSTDGYTEGAFASGRPGQTNLEFMFALNSDPTTDSSYTTLDYAWYTTSAGNVQIYENGSLIGTFGTYTTSTVLAIRHVGALVQYIKDGVVVRSVPRTSNLPLFFDSSFLNPGAKLLDIQYGPAGRGAEADPSAVYLETFEQPWETSWENVANASNLVATYPNNGQFGGKVLSAQRMFYAYSNEIIPFDSSALYRITTRIRRTVSGGGSNELVYCGVVSLNAAGALLTFQQNCAGGFDMSTIGVGTWKDFVGYFRGTGAVFGVAETVDTPTNLDATTVAFRPALILNYTSGTGTMECDFIKIERLVTPDDADNSDKRRLVPDAEFDRSSSEVPFWSHSNSVSPAGSKPSLSLTGGLIGGRAQFSTNVNGGAFGGLVSRRYPPAQAFPGTYYSGRVRWRRTTSVNGTFEAGALRHENSDLPGSSTVIPDPALDADVVMGYGGFRIATSDINARTINSWYEDTFVTFLPATPTNGTSPYVAAFGKLTYSGTASQIIQVDMLDLQPGIAFDPQNVDVTSGTTLGSDAIYKNYRYNHGSSTGSFVLPAAGADLVLGRVFFQQMNAGTLAVAAAGGNTLLSQPNVTGTRNLNGRYARAYAECVSSTEWLIVGQLQ